MGRLKLEYCRKCNTRMVTKHWVLTYPGELSYAADRTEREVEPYCIYQGVHGEVR